MKANNTLSFAERLAIFYEPLAASPACQTSDEALVLLITTLEAVEDEFSGVIKNPTPGLKPDGRMHAPQPDFITLLPDGARIALSRRHQMFFGADGSLKVVLIST